jgi:hypothetical protein
MNISSILIWSIYLCSCIFKEIEKGEHNLWLNIMWIVVQHLGCLCDKWVSRPVKHANSQRTHTWWIKPPLLWFRVFKKCSFGLTISLLDKEENTSTKRGYEVLRIKMKTTCNICCICTGWVFWTRANGIAERILCVTRFVVSVALRAMIHFWSGIDRLCFTTILL